MAKELKEYSDIEIFEELEKRKNEYGYFTSKCKVCGKALYEQKKPSESAMCMDCIYERVW